MSLRPLNMADISEAHILSDNHRRKLARRTIRRLASLECLGDVDRAYPIARCCNGVAQDRSSALLTDLIRGYPADEVAAAYVVLRFDGTGSRVVDALESAMVEG